MEEQYKDSLDHFEGDEIPAIISLYINPDTEDLSFACDWLDDDKSVYYVGEMLFQLKYVDLVDKIIEKLYEQCVIEDRLDSFNKITSIIKQRKEQAVKKENIAVSPRDVNKL
tara:strand:+ start:315 stop:650 length:336 start_codon:yes stop_codon:yes gene_type:complete